MDLCVEKELLELFVLIMTMTVLQAMASNNNCIDMNQSLCLLMN